MHTFDIYFSGQLMPQTDPDRVRSSVGALFRLEGKPLDRLFSGKPVKIKQAVDVETANRYRAAFREAGALLDIVPHQQPPPQPANPPAAGETAQPQTPTAEAQDMSLLPPRSGSLEDCAAEVPPAPVPDTDWMSLDVPGVQLDETPAPPPLQVDISGLTAAPPNSGSLEDCAGQKPAQPIPDISHLQLALPGEEKKTD